MNIRFACCLCCIFCFWVSWRASASEELGKTAWDDDTLLEDLYFSGESVKLTAKEMNALMIAKSWQQGEIITENPVVGRDGAIEFLYGSEQPSVVCAVMQITDIELQKGENVTSVNLGDSARWQIQPAVSGGDITHILIRPRQIGLETSMVVTTDRRTYHIRLRSHRDEYMPRVKFYYIENALEKWADIKTRSKQDRERATIPETNEYLGDLDFNYSVKGKASWKPVRVYNDEVKTIIEMPATFTQKEAPTLLVVRKNGRVLRKNEQVMVNYRLQRGRYIVDAVFDQAVLIVSVGGNQEKITITRTAKKKRK